MSPQKRAPTVASPVGLVSRRDHAWEAVRRYVEEQIGDGTYPVGSYLPSVRELAVRLGINRNTVSKAYQDLARDGVLRPVHGRGVRVVRKRSSATPGEVDLEQHIDALVRVAQFYGLSRDSLLERLDEASALLYRTSKVRIAFVECNDGDTIPMSRDLSRQLGLDVQPLGLDALTNAPAERLRDLRIVATTFFHLSEVSEAVGSRDIDVVGINHVVSHESALAIATLKRSASVAIICPNERTLNRVRTTVESLRPGPAKAYAGTNRSEIARILKGVDTVIDTTMTHERVLAARPRIETITIKFNVEPQSIEYLGHAIREATLSAERADRRANARHDSHRAIGRAVNEFHRRVVRDGAGG